MRTLLIPAATCLTCLMALAQAQDIDNQKLAGFDEYMNKKLKDWNGPGIGVGIVVGDKLVFAKGTGTATTRKSCR